MAAVKERGGIPAVKIIESKGSRSEKGGGHGGYVPPGPDRAEKSEFNPRGLLLILAVLALTAAGAMAIGDAVNTVPKTIFFGTILSLGFGGLVTFMTGTVKFVIGKTLAATGAIGALLFLLALTFHAFGLYRFPEAGLASPLIVQDAKLGEARSLLWTA